MFSKKNLLLCFILIVSAIGICSCTSQGPTVNDSSVIISSGSECHIVYSKASSDYIVRQAKNLETQIEEYCGSFVTLKSDWSSSTESNGKNDAIEILFGQTDRQESQAAYDKLPENGYIITESNGKIIIAATSEKLLRTATLRFFSEYMSLNNGINFPKNSEIIESDFPFFNIAYNGISDTKIIIPVDSSLEIEKMAQYAAYQINSKCNTEIQVVKNLPSVSIKDSILITNNSKRLSDGEYQISFTDSTLHIEGANELSTINALSIFINHVINSCDKKSDGFYHIYFPKNELIASEWNYSIPIFPGGSYVGMECISSNNYCLQFVDVLEDDYRNYLEVLKILGFSSYSSSENKNLFSANFRRDNTDISVNYSTEKGLLKVNISGSIFNK